MVAGKPKWKSWFTRQNDGIMSRLRARLTLTTKRSIRGNKMTTSTSGKRKQKKGSAPTGDSQPAAGGELHQIAAGEHPALTTNPVSYTHLRAHETRHDLVCRLLLEK